MSTVSNLYNQRFVLFLLAKVALHDLEPLQKFYMIKVESALKSLAWSNLSTGSRKGSTKAATRF